MGTHSCVVLWPFKQPRHGKYGGELSEPPKPALARHAHVVTPTIAHNRIYFCKCTRVITPLTPSARSLCPTLSFSNALTHFHKIMADRNSRFSVKKKEKKVENKTNDEKDKEREKGKEKILKKPEKPVKKPEKTPEQPKTDGEKRNGESEGATGAEENNSEGNGEFQPMELPPFEIVTGWV